MKKLVTLIAFIAIAFVGFSQTYKLPVNPGLDSLALLGLSRKGGNVDPSRLTTIPVQTDDSLLQFVFTRYKKYVPPAIPPSTGYTLVYSTGYDNVNDLDPFGHGQIGSGSLSTTIYKTGPGSFKSVPANVSSGIRSEVQYGSGQTPLEGIVEYDVYYDNFFSDNGHSIQWHPTTSGGSGTGLYHKGGKLQFVTVKSGTSGTNVGAAFSVSTKTWHHIKLTYKFGSAGYIIVELDGVIKVNVKVQMGDGSSPYLKVGVNMWVNQTSVVYYDNLRVYKKDSGTPPVNLAPVARAGSDIALVLPSNTTTLDGSGSTDDGAIVSYNWSLASGTGAYTLGSANSVSTSVTGLEAGTYTFKLTVTDNLGVVGTDNVNVVVNTVVPPQPTDTSGILFEGYGALATGGANSNVVYHVTTTQGTGPGSLVYGLGSNKTIVFDAAGTSTQRIDISNLSNLSILGGTAPFPGYSISTSGGDGISVMSNSHNIVISSLTTFNCSGDGINVVDGAHDIMITNCTSFGNHDGNIDVAWDDNNKAIQRNVSIQYCIIGPNHGFSEGNSGGSLTTKGPVSFHHNLTNDAVADPSANNKLLDNSGQDGERNPFAHSNYGDQSSPEIDVVNNLLSNWGRNNASGSGYGVGIAFRATANVINNYGKTKSSAAANDFITNQVGGGTGTIAARGNVSGNGVNENNTIALYPVPLQYQVKAQSACDAARRVLLKAGVLQRDTNGNRNTIDAALVAGIGSNLTGCPVQ